jgi:TonB family protein
MAMRRTLLLVVTAAVVLPASACVTDKDVEKLQDVFTATGTRPDTMPVMNNRELPFRYPSALYAQKVQGNVTLRIFIDTAGRVHPESTLVVEPSGYPALDSAAIRGSQELTFIPAKKRDAPIAVSVLYPVYFRHPEAAPLPGDTILQRYSKPVPPK